MWLTCVQAAAAIYLIGGSLYIDASPNTASKLAFKVLPMLIGFPLAIGVAGRVLGWPI